MSIGQVVLGSRDLDATAAKLRADGFVVLDGGVHPGLGTANRVVPLGDAYLEVLGVVDDAEARAHEYGRALVREIAHGDRFVRWSIRTDDIEHDAARLDLLTERRQRTRPDGSTLRWRAAGLDEALAQSSLPFFMQWDDPVDFPGALPAAHPLGRCSLSWIEVAPADRDAFDARTAGRDLPLHIVGGDPGIRAAAITTPSGERVLRP